MRPNAINALLGPDAVHQGLYLEAEPLPAPGIDTCRRTRSCSLSIRSPIPTMWGDRPYRRGLRRHGHCHHGAPCAERDRVLAKSASGGLEHVPLIAGAQPRRGVDRPGRAWLQTHRARLGCTGFRSRHVAGEGGAPFSCSAPRARGCASAPARCCDVLARIDFTGEIRSVNVSNAAAIALYAITRGKGGAC